MRFGVATGIENIEILEKAGFDYIEWSVTTAAGMNNEDFKAIAKKVTSSSIKCEAMNCFFPWDIKIVGPEVSKNYIQEYIKIAFDRLSQLGSKVVVVGSGGARKVPEGWDLHVGCDQFSDVLINIGQEAIQYGITVVLEPLNKGETNLINDVNAGFELVNKINHPNIKLLADFFHMRTENEDMVNIEKASTHLRHLHIANSNGRVFPKHKDEDDYINLFIILKEIGYKGRMSIEASTINLKEDAPKALELLKALCLNVY
jgi:D-psicose/D-tagatose/L-ribulose 3-epimerase